MNDGKSILMSPYFKYLYNRLSKRVSAINVLYKAKALINKKELKLINQYTKLFLLFTVTIIMSGCGDLPASVKDYQSVDTLYEKVASNLETNKSLKMILEIDHSRLGAKEDSFMPPSRVMMFSNEELENALLRQNSQVAMELPLRILFYKESNSKEPKIIYNSLDYISKRYDIEIDDQMKEMFNGSMSYLLTGIDVNNIASFENDTIDDSAIITLKSPYDFEKTWIAVNDAIKSQGDTIIFGEVDYQKQLGGKEQKTKLLLFGGPKPGAKAMKDAVTLGLDAFCQKLLVWEDPKGNVFVSYNDLLLLAERQNVAKSIALRIINWRLNHTFSNALDQ